MDNPVERQAVRQTTHPRMEFLLVLLFAHPIQSNFHHLQVQLRGHRENSEVARNDLILI